MGGRSAKASPPLSQTLVPPSEPVTPPTTSSQQLPPCPTKPSPQNIKTPEVSHAEWDECMRQSVLTIGSTTAAAIAIAMMVPVADTALLLGTGAGVLWSVKRCRALMRDGILSPEQAKALELKKKTEREEKRRQRKMEKEAKQRAAAEQKLLKKQKEAGNKKGGSSKCCENLKKILVQKGVSVDDVPCEKLSHTNQVPQFNVEKALAIKSQLADDMLQGRTLQEDQPANLKRPINKVSYSEGESKSPRIVVTEKPEKVNPQRLNSSAVQIPVATLVKESGTDTYSTVKLFAPYSRYLSESVILTCDSKECTCQSNKDDPNCTCDPTLLSYGEPQQYTLATDAENEDPPLKEDLANLVVQQVNSIANDMAEVEIKSEVQASAQGATTGGDSSFPKNDILEQPVKEEIPVQESEEDEDEVELIMSPAFDSIESLNDDDSIELIIEDHDDMDIKIEESHDVLDIEVMKNDVGYEQIKQLKNEVDGVLAETYKSESWPFSFSLPSLDKFSKKKNSSFKWPPLTSSIIVKPKKEPNCKCPDGAGKQKENAHKGCTCGSSKNDCTCP